ncbi:MAG: PTS transporter subunit EIIC [Spirochaetia bacterium]
MSTVKDFFARVLAELQKIGQALVLPIAVLPIAGIFLRLGQPDLLNNEFIMKAGLVVFENLALLFAIGIAGGLARDRDVAAGLAGGLAYMILTTVTQVINPANNMAVFGGVIAGLIGGYTYNRFAGTVLPVFLAFFGGKRFVPIVAGFISLIVGVVLGYLWPFMNAGITGFAVWITKSGGIGLFFYGIFNRLLIPFGMQHIIEKFAYFVLGEYATPAGDVVTGDLQRFFAGDPNAGMFMSGFYPVMIFGLPSAALAMYLSVPKERRNAVLGLLFSAALTSLLTGVTEPIEFSFLFVAPLLYAVHAVFMGLSFSLAHVLGLRAGFTFSGGLIDMILSWNLFTNGWIIFLLGAAFAVLYFFSFTLLIRVFNLQTPGRGESVVLGGAGSQAGGIKNKKYQELAPSYVAALGGAENFVDVTNCVSRLRLKLKNSDALDEVKLKSLGAIGVVKLQDTVQVVIGADVEFLAAEIKAVLKK